MQLDFFNSFVSGLGTSAGITGKKELQAKLSNWYPNEKRENKSY